jgi:3-hydroxybutyryl-CoA dehydrogenase
MGSGIAHAFLTARSEVVLIEIDEAAAGRAQDEIARLLTSSAKRGTLTETIDEALNRLTATTDFGSLTGTGLVIEAVPEIGSMKATAMSNIEGAVTADAIIASNTSSMSITDLALNLNEPTRFIGMHYFNPVPASQLVEIVRGEQTTDAVVEITRAAAVAIGKEPIVVHDSPGFASSRLGLALGLEAIRMVESGVASPTDIDTAMTLGYKHPVGPLRLTDMVGLDVRLDIANYLHEKLGDRFEPPRLLRDMVARGDVGRKSGLGFFDWSSAE